MSSKNYVTPFALFGLILGVVIGYVYYNPQLSEKNIEIKLMKNRLLEYEKELLNLQGEIDNLESDLGEVRKEYSELNISYDELKNQKDELLIDYQKLNLDYIELNNQLNNVSDRYEEMMERYLDILEYNSDPINITKAENENFLEYSENDLDNVITVYDNQINWHKMDRKMIRNISKEYKSQYSTNFIHQLSFCIKNLESGNEDNRIIMILWRLSLNDIQVKLYAAQNRNDDDAYNLVLLQRNMDNKVFVYRNTDNSEPLHLDKEYSAVISKQGNLYSLLVYDGSFLAADSGYQKGLSVNYNELSLVCIDDYDDDLNDWSSGYIKDLKIYN